MVALLSVSFVFSFVGVLIMLFSLLWGFDNLHKLGRAGLEQMTSGMRGSAGLKDAVGGAGARCVIGSTAPRATSNSDSRPSIRATRRVTVSTRRSVQADGSRVDRALHRLLPDTWARHRSATAVAARSASCETEFGSLSFA